MVKAFDARQYLCMTVHLSGVKISDGFELFKVVTLTKLRLRYDFEAWNVVDCSLKLKQLIGRSGGNVQKVMGLPGFVPFVILLV